MSHPRSRDHLQRVDTGVLRGPEGVARDFVDIDLLYRRSIDGGVAWSPVRVLIKLPEPQPRNPFRLGLDKINGNDPSARTYHNCVMISDRATGSVHCIFCLDYWRCFYMRSDDDGITFGPPREITDVVAGYRRKNVDWQLVGNGCGHGLQLASGRLVEALWLSHPTGLGGGGPRHSWWYPANVGVLYSDDHGGTWKIGDWVIRASAKFPHPNETCEVELADGRVLFNTRVEGPFTGGPSPRQPTSPAAGIPLAMTRCSSILIAKGVFYACR